MLEETYMKLTESQLKEIIYEEIAAMVEEGEIDEGILSGLSALAKGAGKGIKSAAQAISKTYKSGSLSGDLSTGQRYMSRLLKKAEKNMDLVPEDKQRQYRIALDRIRKGLSSVGDAVADLQGMEREQKTRGEKISDV